MQKITRVLLICVLSAIVVATTGCRSNKNEAVKKTGKLTILSDRSIVPPPLPAPNYNQPAVVKNADVVPEVIVDNDRQPDLPQSEGAVFQPISSEDLMPVISSIDNTPVALDTAAPAASVAPAAPARTYTVKSGDYLSSIAYRYRIKWQDLAKINNLTGKSVLRIGQVLVLPENAAQTPRAPQVKKAKAKTTVKAAEKTTEKAVEKAVEKTAEKTDKATAGKASKGKNIPADGFYTVVKNDNLWLIARRFNLKSDDIRKLNPDVNFNNLQIGKRIRLTDGASAAPAAAAAVAPVVEEAVDEVTINVAPTPAAPAEAPAGVTPLPAGLEVGGLPVANQPQEVVVPQVDSGVQEIQPELP